MDSFSPCPFQVFEEAVCAAVGHKKFGGKTFIDEALELFEENFFSSKDD